MKSQWSRRSRAPVVLMLTAAMAWAGCAENRASSNDNGNDNGNEVCGNGVLEAGEGCDDGNTVAGDGCDGQCNPEGCGDHCECSPLADVSDLIGASELFFGYALLGADISLPDCGERENAKEIYVSLTPDFDGELVVSTVHPTTQVDTVLEVRGGSCDGSSLGCVDSVAAGTAGSRITIPVQAGQPYVAMVETSNDESGVFALGVHRAGVCEGLGSVEDITADLLSGRRFVVDTQSSGASMSGSCSEPGDANPEALLSFTPPHSGRWVATTAHPDTAFDTLLYLRQGSPQGEPYCDSPEVEVACANDSAAGGTDPMLRFEAVAGLPYSLFVDGGAAGAQGSATVLLGTEHSSPSQQSLLGCNHSTILDQLAFFAEAGQAVFLNVDTVDAATAADLRMRILRPNGIELHEADDEVSCSFPPPAYSCPEYSFTADTTGLYYVEVYVGSTQQCFDNSRVNYQLTATLDGQQTDLILLQDQ